MDAPTALRAAATGIKRKTAQLLILFDGEADVLKRARLSAEISALNLVAFDLTWQAAAIEIDAATDRLRGAA